MKELLQKPQNLFIGYIFWFVILFLLTRLLFVGMEEINPDTVNWYYRSEQFVVGLKSGDLAKTYQHYHPGVPLMWMMGTTIEISKRLTDWGPVINHENFLNFHVTNKIVMTLVQLVVSLFLIFVLGKIIGNLKAVLVTLLFSLEPFFIGNSRFLHLDVLLSLFMFLTLCTAYYNFIKLDKPKVVWTVLLAVFSALTFLTKSIGISIVPMVVLLIFVGGKDRVKHLLLYIALFVLSLPFILPAMFTNYIGVIQNIFLEALRIGNKNGHEQVFLGEETMNAGFWFYFAVLAIKFSPLMLFASVLGFINVYKNRSSKDFKFYLLLAVYYIGYFLVMSLLSKKLDRYMIPLYPFLAVFAVYAFDKYYKAADVRAKVFGVVFTLLTFLNVYSVLQNFPYYFTYASPVIGGAPVANLVINQKPFGIGVIWLRDYILEKYGDYPTVGIYDRKPLSMIYKSSRLYNYREYGPSNYEVLVVGVNEEFPRDILGSDYSFELSDTLYINGLEYWRIYVRKT